jgi:Coenzyme PQQ synthesis protein D (PqqD)
VHDLNLVPRQSTEAVSRELADGAEAVILHVGSGQYHSVNATGALIWSLIDGKRSVADVAAEVSKSFADGPGDVVGEVARFIEDLRARQLII